MITRKELKKNGKKLVKKRYLFLIVVCLISAIWGTEMTESVRLLGFNDGTGSSIFETSGVMDVYNDISRNKLSQGEKTADKELKKYKSEKGNKILGRTNGVLAKVVNNISSGSFFISITKGIESMIGSAKAATAIFVFLSLLVWMLFWVFLRNVYRAILRRLFLEARVYRKPSLADFLFLKSLGKWGKASLTLFVTYLLNALWYLTIVGGIIKKYSYFMVPYLVAENPDIKPLEAITLSRKMMKGHKWECFVLQISFIGWWILDFLTFGLVSLFYLNAYRSATNCEYFVNIRALAKENNIDDSDRLCNTYLYETPDEEKLHKAYDDVLKKKKALAAQTLNLSKLQRFLSDNFGIWIGSAKNQLLHQEIVSGKAQVNRYNGIIEGDCYPERLDILWKKSQNRTFEILSYVRSYSLWSLILVFFAVSFIGWCWEVGIHLVEDGVFVNRGTLFGPWLPIYGSGGVLILVLLNRFRTRPALQLLTTVFVCGVVEYFSAYYLEVTHNGMRWWDYSGCFLNLDGRICAEGLIAFAIGGVAIVYLIGPLIDSFANKIKRNMLIPLCVLLIVLFAIDGVYSSKHPNEGKGITDYKTTSVVESVQGEATASPYDIPLSALAPQSQRLPG